MSVQDLAAAGLQLKHLYLRAVGCHDDVAALFPQEPDVQDFIVVAHKLDRMGEKVGEKVREMAEGSNRTPYAPPHPSPGPWAPAYLLLHGERGHVVQKDVVLGCHAGQAPGGRQLQQVGETQLVRLVSTLLLPTGGGGYRWGLCKHAAGRAGLPHTQHT